MISIENNARFSKSLLWQAQRDYYDKQGAQAWAADVPFYITSNPFIANSYAKLILNFIQDCRTKNINGKFYIIELGTGSGQFSFYTLKQLHIIGKELGLKNFPFCYVMTDFTENNIRFWQQNPSLKPFIDDGTVDFAKFDVEHDSELKLIQSNTTLSSKNLTTPLIVIANYLFDSIVNDIFEIRNGKIYESLINVTTTKSNINGNMPKDWKQVKIKHNEKLLKLPYYSNNFYNKILDGYKKTIEDSFINFPNGSLDGIHNLNKIANNKLLLLSSDKGFMSTTELDNMEFPELDFHGSFSLMVNYHAIGEYFKLCGGDAFLQTARGGLSSCAFINGMKWHDLPLSNLALAENFEGVSPTDYFHLFDFLSKRKRTLDLETIAATLSLSNWDPHTFMQLYDRLLDLLEDADEDLIEFILAKTENIADNFYFVPECDDVFFAIGTLFYSLDDYTSALHYYQLSLKFFPHEATETLYNMGLCHYYAKRFQPAQRYFEKALVNDPKFKQAKNMIASIKRKR